jgi:hypothetical protein
MQGIALSLTRSFLRLIGKALLTIPHLAGLSVHMNQVHKENLTSVENALPNRQGLEIEIFGMEGVPDDIIQQHNQRIIQNFYTAQAERQAATGNPPRGLSGGQGPAKKLKYETPEELKKRLAEHRANVTAQKAAGTTGAPIAAAPADGQSPAQAVSFPLPLLPTNHHPIQSSHLLYQQNPPFSAPQPGYPYPAPGAVPPYPAAAQGYPPAGGAFPPGATPLPARPPSGSAGAAGAPPPYYYNGAAPPSTVDELVANAAARQGAPGGDDIDHMIRMAEAGIRPGAGKTEEASAGGAGEKRKKGTRMVYGDTEVSPEEKMAMLPRYRWVEGTA